MIPSLSPCAPLQHLSAPSLCRVLRQPAPASTHPGSYRAQCGLSELAPSSTPLSPSSPVPPPPVQVEVAVQPRHRPITIAASSSDPPPPPPPPMPPMPPLACRRRESRRRRRRRLESAVAPVITHHRRHRRLRLYRRYDAALAASHRLLRLYRPRLPPTRPHMVSFRRRHRRRRHTVPFCPNRRRPVVCPRISSLFASHPFHGNVPRWDLLQRRRLRSQCIRHLPAAAMLEPQ